MSEDAILSDIPNGTKRKNETLREGSLWNHELYKQVWRGLVHAEMLELDNGGWKLDMTAAVCKQKSFLLAASWRWLIIIIDVFVFRMGFNLYPI